MEYTPHPGKARPSPKLQAGKWTVDLRALGYGQRYTLSRPGEVIDGAEATARAWELLEQLRGRRMAEVVQGDLFTSPAPKSFAAASDAWHAHRRAPDSRGSREYVADKRRVVRAHLGAHELEDFNPPHGSARLAAYVRQLEARGLAGRTVRNLVCEAEQVIRHAVSMGWLRAMPTHPKMPPKAPPVFKWITEPMFRALRAEVYRAVTVPMMRWAKVKTAEELRLYVERRRVYLSWLFYTGHHRADADHATADWLFLDGRSYIRHNTKSSKSVRREQFEMPEPLHADLMALVELQGRPFRLGEAFTGGPWREVAKATGRAARALGFPHGCNPSILRRSYAREMFLHGYDVHEVADRMGHVDERMLREIYVNVLPRGAGRAVTRWKAAPESTAPQPGAGLARVLQIKGPS